MQIAFLPAGRMEAFLREVTWVNAIVVGQYGQDPAHEQRMIK